MNASSNWRDVFIFCFSSNFCFSLSLVMSSKYLEILTAFQPWPTLSVIALNDDMWLSFNCSGHYSQLVQHASSYQKQPHKKILDRNHYFCTIYLYYKRFKCRRRCRCRHVPYIVRMYPFLPFCHSAILSAIPPFRPPFRHSAILPFPPLFLLWLAEELVTAKPACLHLQFLSVYNSHNDK